MTFTDLKKVLDPEYKVLHKDEFVRLCKEADGRLRVGGPKGKHRITAKRALLLLGVPDDSYA